VSGAGGDIGFDIDGGDLPARTGEVSQEGRVVSGASADLQDLVAELDACSSIIAWIPGSDTALIVTPCSSRLVRMLSRAYASSSVAPGANRCRGTSRKAASTAFETIVPSPTSSW